MSAIARKIFTSVMEEPLFGCCPFIGPFTSFRNATKIYVYRELNHMESSLSGIYAEIPSSEQTDRGNHLDALSKFTNLQERLLFTQNLHRDSIVKPLSKKSLHYISGMVGSLLSIVLLVTLAVKGPFAALLLGVSFSVRSTIYMKLGFVGIAYLMAGIAHTTRLITRNDDEEQNQDILRLFNNCNTRLLEFKQANHL